jgi:nucleoside-diphosphate-sugar epimerase
LYSITLPDVSSEDLAFFKADTLVITIPPGRRRENAQELYAAEITASMKFASSQNCGSIIYTSSTGVYGEISGQVTETTPLALATASARAVFAAEERLRKGGIPATLLRLAGLYGPARPPGRWFGGKETIPNGDAPVNLVHQADVVSAILAVIDQNAWGNTYNVCATDHPAKGEFYTKAAAELGLGIPTPIPGGGEGKWVDNGKLREELGWEPKHELG